MLQLAWPLALLALILPYLVARLAPAAAPVTTPLRVPFLAAAKGWSRGGGAGPSTRRWLALAAWVALVAAASRPQWIGDAVAVPVSGRSMMLALDVSASMRRVGRGGAIGLDVVRGTVKAFLAGRDGDRIGLIVFGSKPYVQSPLTYDRDGVSAMVDEMFIGQAGDGTALGDAIALGVARLRTMRHDERVLVVLTDGDSTEGVMTVSDAARLARHHGVRVYAIGVGAVGSGGQEGGLNEPALGQLAAATGGRYFHAEDAGALERVYRALARHEPVARDARRFRPTAELYPWALGMALALALAALLVDLRGGRATRGRG